LYYVNFHFFISYNLFSYKKTNAMSKFYNKRNFVLLPLLFLLFSTKMMAQDLSVTVTSNQATFSIYNYITFYVDARNNGTTTVNNVRVSLPMPAGAAFDCGFAPQGVWESWTPSGYWTVVLRWQRQLVLRRQVLQTLWRPTTVRRERLRKAHRRLVSRAMVRLRKAIR
jgi:uncharacterized repeat protein (TIGR01451 family)